ncbi:MAG: hypothetical protein HYY78_05000 [Betaproteobacteria bacterium]|nr:hypothetical protein [Betaproteobacteria bacterium]
MGTDLLSVATATDRQAHLRLAWSSSQRSVAQPGQQAANPAFLTYDSSISQESKIKGARLQWHYLKRKAIKIIEMKMG